MKLPGSRSKFTEFNRCAHAVFIADSPQGHIFHVHIRMVPIPFTFVPPVNLSHYPVNFFIMVQKINHVNDMRAVIHQVKTTVSPNDGEFTYGFFMD